MTNYSLNIAGYTILFNAMTDGISLSPSPSQEAFVTSKKKYDIALNVFRGPVDVREEATAVFRAPYVEEIGGRQVKKSDKFWTVYRLGDYILIRTTCPVSEDYREALLIIRPGEKSWDIIIDSSSESLDPLCYPLDGLLLYYITALNGDIFIHASAVRHKKKAYLFTGKSGRGKTTIAGICGRAGWEVIHDDRLILRKKKDRIFVHNTPVYEDEIPMEAELSCIYVLNHGGDNSSVRIDHSEAMAAIMANCIQHHWDPGLIGGLTGSILDLVNKVTVRTLYFVPDPSVINFIENDEC